MARHAHWLLLGLLGCGGTDGVDLDASSDATGGDSTSQADTSTTDGATNDVTTTSDASNDAGVTDGAATDADAGLGTPNHVQCGTALCALPAQVCCSTKGTDGGITLACTNSGSCTGAARECDQAADCTGGEVCCYEENNGTSLSASCRGDCSGGGGTRFQACASSTECLSGTCTTHTHGGFSVETCVAIPGICP